MTLETYMKLCVTEPDFPEFFSTPKIGKMEQKMGPKKILKFLLNLFCNENLYLLCSCTNPIFGKIFVSEIWAKIFPIS